MDRPLNHSLAIQSTQGLLGNSETFEPAWMSAQRKSRQALKLLDQLGPLTTLHLKPASSPPPALITASPKPTDAQLLQILRQFKAAPPTFSSSLLRKCTP